MNTMYLTSIASPSLRSTRAILFALGMSLTLSSTFAAEEDRKHYFFPDADTFIRGGDGQHDNFGTDTTFQVRGASNRRYNRVAYVRFRFEDRPSDRVQAADFTIHLASIWRNRNQPSRLRVYGLMPDYQPRDGQLGHDWDEQTLTNANAPWPANLTHEPPNHVALLGELRVPGRTEAATGQAFTVAGETVSRYVNTLIGQGHDAATFIIVETENTPNVITFLAKENSSFEPSVLSLTFTDAEKP